MLHLLTILFIGLKLGGVIGWAWLFVLAPTLFVLAFRGLVFMGGVALLAFIAVLESIDKASRK